MKCFNDWIRSPIDSFTRGRLQTNPVSNQLHGKLEICANMSLWLMLWQASSSAQNTTHRQLFQAFRWRSGIHHAMFVNTCATNALNTAHIHTWWYEEIARIDPAQRLWPFTCQQFSGIWIISTIVFITDVVYQVLEKITCSRAAMVYHCKTSIDSIYRFRTQSPTEILKIVA